MPQVSHAYDTIAPLGIDDEMPLARLDASVALMGREAFDVVWYIELRSSSEAGVADGCLGAEPFMEAWGWVGLVPGCRDWRPRGVSRVTR